MPEMQTPLVQAPSIVRHKQSGASHWWGQRLSAIMLAPLMLWFVFSALGLIGADHVVFVIWGQKIEVVKGKLKGIFAPKARKHLRKMKKYIALLEVLENVIFHDFCPPLRGGGGGRVFLARSAKKISWLCVRALGVNPKVHFDL